MQDSKTVGLVRSFFFKDIKWYILYLNAYVFQDVERCVLFFLGGEVTFDLTNDAPTLTGAKSTFTIKLNFPSNQTVRSDGEVVWSRNCTINGKMTLVNLWREGHICYYIMPYIWGKWTKYSCDYYYYYKNCIGKTCSYK